MQGFAQLRAARKSQQADRRVGRRGKLEVDVHHGAATGTSNASQRARYRRR